MTNPSFLLYLLIPASYIIGSIPFGILVSRRKGIDLRTIGSGNIGATNVLRAAGKIPALLTLTGDTLKGALPVLLCRVIITKIEQTTGQINTVGELWGGIIGLAAVVGHIYPVFFSFKGGKGVATGFGVVAAYSPLSAVIMLIIWISTAVFTRYSSLAAISAFVMLPVIFILLGDSGIKISFGILLGLLIVFKHSSNIKKIIQGTESKIRSKK